MHKKQQNGLKSSILNTPVGEMVAISDNESLLLLEFIDCKSLEAEIETLKEKTQKEVSAGLSSPLDSIKKELLQYFKGDLNVFKTPLNLLGTSFQNEVWKELLKISYGNTCSYADVARSIGRPSAFRAVARANGANRLVIIIPCHRVINSNGCLGGYNGGLHRKEKLLALEKS